MERNKRIGLILIAAAAVTLTIAAFMTAGRRGNDEEAVSGNVYMDVPDAEQNDMPESKSDAYMAYNGSQKGIEDYWDQCEDEYSDTQTDSGDRLFQEKDAASPASAEDLFGNTSQAMGGAQRSSGAGASNPYRESASEREARHQRRREEALELADRMTRGQEEPVPAAPAEEQRAVIIPSGSVRRSEVISSLDDRWQDGGVSSLDSPASDLAPDGLHPFKCMFVRDEKIRSGQRVSIRLLEDIVVSGTLIPRNTHIMASCKIGTRLELDIASMEMQGRILNLGYEAYDTDGSRGIYCPETDGPAKTVRDRGTSLAGSMLRSRVGRVAGDVITTGVTIAQNASGERTVSVPAGYTFYIVKKNQ